MAYQIDGFVVDGKDYSLGNMIRTAPLDGMRTLGNAVDEMVFALNNQNWSQVYFYLDLMLKAGYTNEHISRARAE